MACGRWGRAPEASVRVHVLRRVPVVADRLEHLRVSVAQVAGPDFGGVCCRSILGLHLRDPAATGRDHKCGQHVGLMRLCDEPKAPKGDRPPSKNVSSGNHRRRGRRYKDLELLPDCGIAITRSRCVGSWTKSITAHSLYLANSYVTRTGGADGAPPRGHKAQESGTPAYVTRLRTRQSGALEVELQLELETARGAREEQRTSAGVPPFGRTRASRRLDGRRPA